MSRRHEILDEARPRYDRNVFDCYIKIGDILILTSDRDGALKEYRVASAIARDLAASNTDSVIWQRNLATSYIKIGDILAAQERCARGDRALPEGPGNCDGARGEVSQSDEWPALAKSLKAKIPEASRAWC